MQSWLILKIFEKAQGTVFFVDAVYTAQFRSPSPCIKHICMHAFVLQTSHCTNLCNSVLVLDTVHW